MKRTLAGIIFFAISSGFNVSGQPAQALPAFEVVSVKPAQPGAAGGARVRGGPGSSDPTLATLENIDLSSLVAMAYAVQRYQLSAPEWFSSTRFDVSGKVPAGATPDEYRLMLRNVLIERFKLTLHHQPKDMQTLELQIGKTGSRLTESTPEPASLPDGMQPPFPPANPPPGMRARGGKFAMQFKAQPVERLTATLSGLLGQPVIDATGLHGRYDIKFSSTTSDAVSDTVPLFEAIQEQLGLKLVPRKGTVDMLVIDHAEKTPSEN